MSVSSRSRRGIRGKCSHAKSSERNTRPGVLTVPVLEQIERWQYLPVVGDERLADAIAAGHQHLDASEGVAEHGGPLCRERVCTNATPLLSARGDAERAGGISQHLHHLQRLSCAIAYVRSRLVF